jgi:hypothetical protein
MRMTGMTLGTLALALVMVPSARGSERPTLDLGLTFGIRWTAPDGWDEFARQQSIGAELSWRRPTWPLFLALDLHAGGKTNSEYDPTVKGTVFTNDGTHFEAALGLRWIRASRRFVASLGSGLAYAYGAYAQDTIRVVPGQSLPDENGSGVGPWLGAEARVRLGSLYSAGAGARITFARGALYGREVDLGGWQAYVTVVGLTWPRRSGG